MTEHLFKTISRAAAALHATPRARFYSTVLVPPSTRAWRNTNAAGEPEIIGHPSYWRALANHPDVTATDSAMPDPFGVPVIDLDTDPDLRRRVLEPIFNQATEAA